MNNPNSKDNSTLPEDFPNWEPIKKRLQEGKLTWEQLRYSGIHPAIYNWFVWNYERDKAGKQ